MQTIYKDENGKFCKEKVDIQEFIDSLKPIPTEKIEQWKQSMSEKWQEIKQKLDDEEAREYYKLKMEIPSGDIQQYDECHKHLIDLYWGK